MISNKRESFSTQPLYTYTQWYIKTTRWCIIRVILLLLLLRGGGWRKKQNVTLYVTRVALIPKPRYSIYHTRYVYDTLRGELGVPVNTLSGSRICDFLIPTNETSVRIPIIYCNNISSAHNMCSDMKGGGAGISLLRKDRLRARFKNRGRRLEECIYIIIIIKYYNSWSRQRRLKSIRFYYTLCDDAGHDDDDDDDNDNNNK